MIPCRCDSDPTHHAFWRQLRYFYKTFQMQPSRNYDIVTLSTALVDQKILHWTVWPAPLSADTFAESSQSSSSLLNHTTYFVSAIQWPSAVPSWCYIDRVCTMFVCSHNEIYWIYLTILEWGALSSPLPKTVMWKENASKGPVAPLYTWAAPIVHFNPVASASGCRSKMEISWQPKREKRSEPEEMNFFNVTTKVPSTLPPPAHLMTPIHFSALLILKPPNPQVWKRFFDIFNDLP